MYTDAISALPILIEVIPQVSFHHAGKVRRGCM